MSEARTEHILVVEDNADTQILLRYLLESRFLLEAVTKVGDALEKTAEKTFDLLLVDINLGEERTGVDLLNILRKNDTYAQIPMVAITAYAMPGDSERFISMGFDGYVSKPFTRIELISAIDKILVG